MATAGQDPLLAAKATALRTLQMVSAQDDRAAAAGRAEQEERESVERAALWSPGAAASLASDLPQPLFPDEVYDAALETPGPAAANGAAAAAPLLEEQQPATQLAPAPEAAYGLQLAAQQQGAPVISEAATEGERPAAGGMTTAAVATDHLVAGSAAQADPAVPAAAAAANGQDSADAATSDEAAGAGAGAAANGAAGDSAGAGAAAASPAAPAGEAGSTPAQPAAGQEQPEAQPSPATQAAHAAAAQQYAAAFYGSGYGDPSAAAWAAYGYGASGYYGSGYDYGASYYGGYSGGPCAALLDVLSPFAACSTVH